MYREMIRHILAARGLAGRYDPRHVEAWMRVEHPTLDALSVQEWAAEVTIALQCIDHARPDDSERLAKSMGI